MKKITAFILSLAFGVLSMHAVSFSLDIPDPDAVIMSVLENDISSDVELHEGINSFNYPERTYVQLKGVDPWKIISANASNGVRLDLYAGVASGYVGSDWGGRIFDIEIKNMDEARTSSCTVIVDDPAMVYATLGNMPLSLSGPTQTVRFDPEEENYLYLRSNDYDRPLYGVWLDESPVQESYSGYYVDLVDGCTVRIQAIFPDEPCTATLLFDEASRGCITSVSVDGTEVENFEDTPISLRTGQRIKITQNPLYQITGFTVNGENTYWNSTSGYDKLIKGDTEFQFSARRYEMIKITVKVTDPADIHLYMGYASQGHEIPLESTVNVVEVPENNATISWEAAQGCIIDKVIVNDSELSWGSDVTATKDMVIEFRTVKLNIDKQAIVWVDRVTTGPWGDSSPSLFSGYGGSPILREGYNIIDFCNEYNPYSLSWNTSDDFKGMLYVNDEHVDPLYTGYTPLKLEDRDVVKLFTEAPPVESIVTFTIEDGVEISVSRDIFVVIENPAEPQTVFQGTKFLISPTGTEGIMVKINNTALNPIPDTGNFEFLADGPEMAVAVISSANVGVDCPVAHKEGREVYNLQGIKVAESTEGLMPGIYIIEGKKIVIR